MSRLAQSKSAGEVPRTSARAARAAVVESEEPESTKRHESKVALAITLLAVGVFGALLFRRGHPVHAPSAESQPAATIPAPLALEESPAATSRLVGRIEPLTPADPDLLPAGITPLAPLTGDDSLPALDDEYHSPQAVDGELAAVDPAVDPDVAAQAIGHTADGAEGQVEEEDGEWRLHRVADGDTLTSLAERYLGDRSRHQEIYELNRELLPDPNVLPIGAELRLPRDSVVADGNVENFPEPGESPRLVPIDPGALRPEGLTRFDLRTYRVQKKDTLGEIARRFYGEPARFHEVFLANRDRLRGPNDLRPGLLIVIP